MREKKDGNKGLMEGVSMVELIPGIAKMATIRLVPKDANKPLDGRTKQGKESKHEQGFDHR